MNSRKIPAMSGAAPAATVEVSLTGGTHLGKADDPRELLADTMKELFPPRVELTSRQYQRLQGLSQKTGKSLRELVQQAIDRYLQEI